MSNPERERERERENRLLDVESEIIQGLRRPPKRFNYVEAAAVAKKYRTQVKDNKVPHPYDETFVNRQKRINLLIENESQPPSSPPVSEEDPSDKDKDTHSSMGGKKSRRRRYKKSHKKKSHKKKRRSKRYRRRSRRH